MFTRLKPFQNSTPRWLNKAELWVWFGCGFRPGGGNLTRWARAAAHSDLAMLQSAKAWSYRHSGQSVSCMVGKLPAVLPKQRAREPGILATKSSGKTGVCSSLLMKQEAKIFLATRSQNPASWEGTNSDVANGLSVLCPQEYPMESLTQIHGWILSTHKSYPLTRSYIVNFLCDAGIWTLSVMCAG